MNDAERRPVCAVLAGPNGSGKSSIYERLELRGTFINADVTARQLAPDMPESVSMAAGRLVLREISDALSQRRDFIYETTLSSHQSIAVMARAAEAGYEVGLVFVALRSVELNIARIAQRVAEGGHHIPSDVVVRRYESSMRRLVQAVRLADGAMIYDNSTTIPSLLIRIAGRAIDYNNLDPAVALHQRIAAAVAEALDLPTSGLFQMSRPAG